MTTRSRGQRKRRRRTTTELTDEVEDLFLKVGFLELTVDTIAARLHCSKRNLYEIAGTKEHIVLHVVGRWLERVRHMGTSAAMTVSEPAEKLAAYMRPGILESSKASDKFVKDIHSFVPTAELLASHQQKRMRILRDIIDDGIKRRRFTKLHAYLVAEVYALAVNRINDPEFLRNAGIHFGEAFDELFRLITEGLFPRKTSPT